MRLAVPSLLVLAALCLAPRALARPGSPSPDSRKRVDQLAAYWARELAARCPVAKPQDEASLGACRKALYEHAGLLRRLADRLLWGRQAGPDASLRDTTLTQLAPDVWIGLYLPLFMFNGVYTVEYVAREQLYRVRLETAFRNRLPPGQFPYPFWHDPQKWSFYQNARTLLLWVDPRTVKVTIAQYTPKDSHPPLVATEPVVRDSFDGKWMWTDASGRLQPQVTLFDGLLGDKNPYKQRVDAAYRDFATRMRAAQCSSCHVPNNPYRTKRLVLLQTPAHASGEIKRVLQSVRENRMPLDRAGASASLDPAVKKALLESGARFDSAVDAAKAWEAQHRSRNTKSNATKSTEGPTNRNSR